VTFSMRNNVAYLTGDWRLASLTKDNINSLASLLQQLDREDIKSLQLDCELITTIDAPGLQLIKVWMQCMRIRGTEPELINPSKNMKQHFKSAGINYKSSLNRHKSSSFEEYLESSA
jgi:anti-anti-sigma regulatory factor